MKQKRITPADYERVLYRHDGQIRAVIQRDPCCHPPRPLHLLLGTRRHPRRDLGVGAMIAALTMWIDTVAMTVLFTLLLMILPPGAVIGFAVAIAYLRGHYVGKAGA